MQDLQIAAAIFGAEAVFPTGFSGAERHDALNQALADLQAVGLVESSSYGWRPLDAGERALKDEVAHWSSVGHFSLTDARMAILELIGRQSQHEAADYAQVDWVDIGSVLQQLRWPEAELRGESRVLLAPVATSALPTSVWSPSLAVKPLLPARGRCAGRL